MPSTSVNYASDIGGLAGATGGIVTGAAALGAATTTLGAATAWTGIGAAAAALVIVLLKIFKGADPNEAIAANIQQIFEIATLNLEALAGGPVNGQWGSSVAIPPLISRTECYNGVASFKQAAIQFESQAAQQTGDPRPFQNGMDACVNEFDGSLAVIPTYPNGVDAVSGAINFTNCHSHYVPQGTKGFMTAGQYGNPSIVDSIQAAWQVTDTYLQSLDRTVANIATNLVSSVGDAVGSAVNNLVGTTPSPTAQAAQQAAGNVSNAVTQAVSGAVTLAQTNPVVIILVIVAIIALLRKVL